MSRRRNPRTVLAALLLALGALAGCGSFAAGVELSSTLSADGFEGPTFEVSTSTGTGDAVSVTSSGHRTLDDADAARRAAGITWTTFPRHLDAVSVSVGSSSTTYRRPQLTAAFSPRDPALDARSISSDARDTLVGVAVGLAVGLLLLVGLIVLLVILIRRRSRRRPPPPGPPPWAQWPAPGR